MEKYDFSGWATKANLKCSDGRTIMKDAFKHCDGQTVPLVWNHRHDDPSNVLGHALLENREEGVYAYCSFNDSESGELAKILVKHGDITSLSIYANQLKQDSSKRVMHGVIREVSLVHAGANEGARIENVIVHSDTGEFIEEREDEADIYAEGSIELYHSEEKKEEKKEETKMAEEKKETGESGKTIADIIETMNEEQKQAFYATVGMILDEQAGDSKEEIEHSEGGNETMKENVFDQEERTSKNVLSHSDRNAIVELSKKPGVGSLKSAIEIFMNEHEELQHAANDGVGLFDQSDATTAGLLFPEPHLIDPGAPKLIRDFDNSWVMKVINKIHKSPFTKIRTRKADARARELQAKGYPNKGAEKKAMGQITLLKRETNPQTVYIKSELHRDDIIDIDWDVVAYQWNVMNDDMYELLATSVLVGDGRDENDPDKIRDGVNGSIRSIYNDDDFYCIHYDVDIEKARKELQGTNTGANFGENYIYAEAVITAALYSREKFKGTGTPAFYCPPHFVNVMLLARDLNGRRIYDSKAELAKALNVSEIVEIEQLGGKTRTTGDGKEKKLLGLFVNLADYTFGCAKGGQLTKFSDFDIDYNKYKYMMETRLSGSLTEPFSAIALEEPVVAE